MKITVICVGKIKEKFYAAAIDEFKKRMSRYATLRILETSDEPLREGSSDSEGRMVMEKEGSRIIKLIPDGAYVVVLDSHGQKMTSEGFADTIQKLTTEGKSHIVFIIGGSIGLSGEVKSCGNLMLSFSDMTFPHQLMRVILLEQIYRAFRIIKGEPYHK